MGALPLVAPHSHAERVFDVEFRNDMLASASEDGDVRLWHLASPTHTVPRLLQVLEHEAEVLRVAWGPSSLLATGTAAGQVRLYSVTAPPDDAAEAAAEVATLVTEFGHPEEGQQVYALRWMDNPDAGTDDGPARLLLTAADDKVYMWDVETQKVTTEWGFQQASQGEAFGGASRNPDGACYVFDVALGRLHPDQSHEVVCLALSDGGVRIQDPRSGQSVATLRREGVVRGHLTALHLGTEDGVLLACGGRGEVTVYDTRTFAVRTVLEAHARPCFGATLVPKALAKEHVPAAGGPVVLTWGADTTVRLFDLDAPGAPPLQVVEHPGFPIYTCAFGTDSTTQGWHLLVGGGEGTQAESHDHDHDHEHEHGEAAGCCGHGEHEHHPHADEGKKGEEESGEDEVEEAPPSLLCYTFAS